MKTLDWMYIVAFQALMGCIGLLGGYYLVKRKANSDFFLEVTDDLLSELSQNVELQKKFYLLGVILGNGIKQGIGLKSGGGKFKFEDLIGMALQGFLGKMIPGAGQGNQSQGSSVVTGLNDLVQ